MNDAQRREFHQLLQQYATGGGPLEGSLLTRWVLLGEWMVPSHDLAFLRLSGQADGRSLTTWDVDGLLHTAMWRQRPTLGPMFDEQGDPT